MLNLEVSNGLIEVHVARQGINVLTIEKRLKVRLRSHLLSSKLLLTKHSSPSVSILVASFIIFLLPSPKFLSFYSIFASFITKVCASPSGSSSPSLSSTAAGAFFRVLFPAGPSVISGRYSR